MADGTIITDYLARGSGPPSGTPSLGATGQWALHQDTDTGMFYEWDLSASAWKPLRIPGVPRVLKFPFAYNTPNLLTGAAVYTPTIGDILLDAWIEIDTAWDGTTPSGDIGEYDTKYGWFADMLGVLNMAGSDVDTAGGSPGDGMLIGEYAPISRLAAQSTIAAARDTLKLDAIPPTQVDLVLNNAAAIYNAYRFPGKFTSANPIKVVVSQDGSNTGSDPGSTQGAAILYLVVATPAAA